ncbi:hypothetical protein KIN34_01820 [Cellulomonas sp. DKR-3]|uniref:SCP domain-containing protein n=1 Tax=Cellulomonas fulva TaxID=2835530 RepID=A0ABS5TV50_9CELL|nr:hypothetical protein [Cellulomonas fulva]MBT0993029.1 hypothetical protein [Cellulomonas fulva]
MPSTQSRAPELPTQRPGTGAPPAPARSPGSTGAVGVPAPRPAPERHAPATSPTPASPVSPAGRPRRVRVVAVTALVGLAVAGTAGWTVQQQAERARLDEAAARVAAQADAQLARTRVDAVLAASRPATSGTRTDVAAYTAEHAAEVDRLTAAADEAADTLWHARHAGDAADELRTAIRHARAVARSERASLASLRDARAGLVGPADAATAAEKAWRTAEARRLAAERAEAERAARERAQQDTQQDRRQDTGTTPPSATPTIPQGGLVCTGTGGPGASEASTSSLGAAINAYRASLGLARLAVVRSGSLVGHALDMGTAGGIWHSGRDNIVGCAGSADPSYLVQAWSHSSSHDAQMRRTDVSTMDVGAALQSGWLFGAVLFR